MGAYLSEPKTEKISEDDENEFVKYGASSMQGWRTSQEDAHIGLLDFDEKSSVFAVFDGHGGGEVAKYCARHLPNFLKNIKHYKEGNLHKALEEAFIEFDSLLITPDIVEELKSLAGDDYIKSDEDEEDEHEASLLAEEAKLPLEALIARYSGRENDPNEVVKRDHIPPHVRLEISASKKNKPISPFLRAKQGPSTSTANEDTKDTSSLCSSSSTTNESEAVNRFEPCSSSSSTSGSSSSSHPLPNGKLSERGSSVDPEAKPSFHKKQQSDVGDSVSSSVNEVIEDKNDICKVSSTKSESTPSSAACDNTVSTAASTSVDEPSSSSKGKGKKKKIVTPENVKSDSTTRSGRPGRLDYKALLMKQVNKIFESATGNARAGVKTGGDGEEDSDYDSSDMEYGEENDIDDDDDDDEDDDEEDDDEDDDDDDDEDGDSFEASTTDFEIPGKDSGCTAVFALLKGNRLYVANAGDSRCVVSRRGKALDMSLDHKPEDTIEKKRIEAAGGIVNSDGRVNGGLNLSRAIGDHAYKNNSELSLKEQMITAFPDIRTAIIKPERDEFMVLACDGIWNSMSSQEVVDFVRERLDDNLSLSSICEKLFDHCLSPDTEGDGTGCDNMTCIIVKFTNVKPTDSQKELSDSDDEEIPKPNEEKPCPSQSDSKKQSAPESQEGSSAEPSSKRQKTDL
ncbi:probable protein phosphatase CG10417 isoform X2 [Panonychus citri]|uniref:probable protein phosphatase CG10417 isoform X2 n=1 Tax=Panonychus citri TaxID=50023 RepID=UPI002307726C|nr:probable protein phosphatase CG10417 isoform X2 [Panonychus citri]